MYKNQQTSAKTPVWQFWAPSSGIYGGMINGLIISAIGVIVFTLI